MSNSNKHVVETENIYIDARHLPFVYLNMSNIPNKKDYAAAADYLDQLIAAGTRSASLADLRDVKKLKLIEITRFWLPWAKKNKHLVDELSVGAAFLNSKPLVVKVLNGVLKVMPLASPLRVFEHKHEAIEWLYQLADKEGLELPAESTWEDL